MLTMCLLPVQIHAWNSVGFTLLMQLSIVRPSQRQRGLSVVMTAAPAAHQGYTDQPTGPSECMHLLIIVVAMTMMPLLMFARHACSF